MKASRKTYLRGKPIVPAPIPPDITVEKLVDNYFQAYNAARLREACQLFTRKMLDRRVTIGMSLTGALTPAGLGGSCVVPLIQHGFVDWIVSTGANLYHDTHSRSAIPSTRGALFSMTAPPQRRGHQDL